MKLQGCSDLELYNRAMGIVHRRSQSCEKREEKHFDQFNSSARADQGPK